MRQLALTFIAILAVTTSVQAQDESTLIGTGSRKIDPAYRIAPSPQIIDTTIPMAVVKYPLLPLKYQTDAEVNQISPVSIRTVDKLKELYKLYAKLGVGTDFATGGIMPLGEVYFDATRSRKFLYGAHVKHLSNWGDFQGLQNSTFDRTKVNLYGGINERRYTLRSNIHYNNQGLHYYGLSDTVSIGGDSLNQRFHDTGFDFSYASHKKDSATLNYGVGILYNNFQGKKPPREDFSDWRARENAFDFNSNAWYRLDKHLFAAEFNVRWNGYKYGILDSSYANLLDTGFVQNNTLINLKPTITTRFQDDRFMGTFGTNIVFDAREKVRAHLYLLAEVKYSMLNDLFIPYIGVRGGMTQTTFKSLAGENEFVRSNIELRNEHKPIEVYGGIKGTLSKRMSFNVSGSFGQVRDISFFVTDTLFSLGNKFDVIYDTANVATIEGSLSYQLKEKIKADAIVRYNSYNVINNSYAWNRPNLEVILRGSYNLFDKFIVNLDLNLEQGRRALVYAPGEGVTLENQQYIKSLGFLADANLGVEYRYNPRISAFIQTNNLASQRYNRWYDYPVQSFQVLGGVTFRL
ncbi:MAG: hypothetical protein AB8B56_16600 [Crocinitomicaceae bacterium]